MTAKVESLTYSLLVVSALVMVGPRWGLLASFPPTFLLFGRLHTTGGSKPFCVRLYHSLPWRGLHALSKLLPLSQPISLRQQPPHANYADHHGKNEDALQAFRYYVWADAHLGQPKQHQVLN